MSTPTNIGLYLLQLYRSKMIINLEQEILNLSYTDLEMLIDEFNRIQEHELAQMLFDRKKILQ